MQKNSTKGLAPITKSIQTRERHVTRADLQRQDVIYEPKQKRHGDEENHGCAVHREELIERVGPNEVIVRHGQLQSDDQGFDSTNDEKEEAGQHVKNTDALVVYSGKPGELVLPALGGIQN